MTQDERAALQRDRLQAIEAEIERRKVTKSDAPLQRIRNELDQMAERLRAAPDWREPTPEEQERNRQVVEAALKEMQHQHDL